MASNLSPRLSPRAVCSRLRTFRCLFTESPSDELEPEMTPMKTINLSTTAADSLLSMDRAVSMPGLKRVAQPALANSHQHEGDAQAAVGNHNLERANSKPTAELLRWTEVAASAPSSNGVMRSVLPNSHQDEVEAQAAMGNRNPERASSKPTTDSSFSTATSDSSLSTEVAVSAPSSNGVTPPFLAKSHQHEVESQPVMGNCNPDMMKVNRRITAADSPRSTDLTVFTPRVEQQVLANSHQHAGDAQAAMGNCNPERANSKPATDSLCSTEVAVSTPSLNGVTRSVLPNSHQHEVEVEAQPAMGNRNPEKANSKPTTVDIGSLFSHVSHGSRKPAQPSDSTDSKSSVQSNAKGRSMFARGHDEMKRSRQPQKMKEASIPKDVPNSQKVNFHMTLHGFDHDKITKVDHAHIHSSFIDCIKEGFLHQAAHHGKKLTKDHIDISLSKGSIKVHAQICPPVGHDVDALHKHLMESDTIHGHILERVKNCHPDIHHMLELGHTLDTVHNLVAAVTGSNASDAKVINPSWDAEAVREHSTLPDKLEIYMGRGGLGQFADEREMEAALRENKYAKQGKANHGNAARKLPKSEFQEKDVPVMPTAIWVVVGGAGVGGIRVQRGEQENSEQLARLRAGSRIRQLDLTGERLKYKLIEGSGPEVGWVSIQTGGKPLVELEYIMEAKQLSNYLSAAVNWQHTRSTPSS